MVFIYIGLGLIVGLVIGALFLDVDSISRIWAKKEKSFDSKEE